MDERGDLLFVYGTLKRGLANHHQLAGLPWAGAAEMAGVDLFDLGPFPMAVAGSGRIAGELYRVDAVTLSRLDRFEGAPRLYERLRRPLVDGRLAWIYLGRPRQVRHSPRLAEGIWPPGAGERRPPQAGHRDALSLSLPTTTRSLRPGDPRRAHRCQPRSGSSLPVLPRPDVIAMAAVLVAGELVGGLSPVRAEASLTLCRRWQASRGEEHIRLGNSLGAAAHLTKQRRLAEADPEAPVLLYAPSDLQRACGLWR